MVIYGEKLLALPNSEKAVLLGMWQHLEKTGCTFDRLKQSATHNWFDITDMDRIVEDGKPLDPCRVRVLRALLHIQELIVNKPVAMLWAFEPEGIRVLETILTEEPTS